MKYRILILFFLCFAAVSFVPGNDQYFNVPSGWPAATYNFSKNPLSKEKILLGRALFFDPVLSVDSTISCVSCHLQYTAFTHVDHTLSHGIDGKIGTRNSPTLINLAWGSLFMWDGAVNHLDMQPLAPIAHPAEMGANFDTVLTRLGKSPKYRRLFSNAFGDSTVTGEHFLKAIAQFMLTLVSSDSKYDKVIRKEKGFEFTDQEQNGYRLFQKNCGNCHKEPLFTTNEFANNGLPVDTTLNDWGRIRVTHQSKDSLCFKIPTLRNIEFSYPYMHDGRFKTLYDVLRHYTTGVRHSPTLAPQLQMPLVLSANEQVDIVAFLLTLTDKKFLFNPDFSFPRQLFLDQ